MQSRERLILAQPADLGVPCPALSEDRHCNTMDCPVTIPQGDNQTQGVSGEHAWPFTNPETADPQANGVAKQVAILTRTLGIRERDLAHTMTKQHTLQGKLDNALEQLDAFRTGEAAERCEKRVMELARMITEKEYLTEALMAAKDALLQAQQNNAEQAKLLREVIDQKDRLQVQLADMVGEQSLIPNGEQEGNSTVQEGQVAGLEAESEELTRELNTTEHRCLTTVRQLAQCNGEKEILEAKENITDTGATGTVRSLELIELKQELLQLQASMADATHKTDVAKAITEDNMHTMADCKSDNATMAVLREACQTENEALETQRKAIADRLNTCIAAKATSEATLEAEQLKTSPTKA